MERTLPLLIVGLLGGLLASLLAGFLLASWALAGIAPAYAAPPIAHEDSQRTVSQDSWREAGYERIGLWEQPRIGDYAEGSSRL